ncbi:thiol reductant ABC exporter subunit CydC [Ktedonobacter racemifer]|uniref:ABC transporter, CydDC cysteine exporter (CydDC-E) family, permease/ATP-binding protein CydC n=1 Tax=Ktedonobacter racemifer DSM 44963 TaxID=485913 RepID=D6U505_KTERA|nr:thiol reductant ABC exporter subunit CydC [Ktedonobacter racemifer]EFH81585.1 ABC transporter, CydDC cysteine exporter (CydDC-E) family, permease/ATP-binding protein CydC [Ktedonobacter racemifer DSM 44963]
MNESTTATFLRLLKLAKPLRGLMALAVLLGFLTIGCGIALLATSAYLISAAALHPAVSALSIAIVGVRAFGIGRGVFRYLDRLVSHEVVFRLLSRIRVWLYNAIEPLAPARLLSFARGDGTGLSSGDLLSRIISDVDALQNVYIRVISPPMVALVVAISVWLFLGAFDPLIGVVFIVTFLLATVGVPLLTHVLSHTIGERLVTLNAQLKTEVVNNIQGMPDIVAFGQEEHQARRLSSLSTTLQRLQRQMANITGIQSALTNLFTNLATWLTLLLAIPLVTSGRLPGVLLAMLVLTVLSSFEAAQPLPAAFQQLGSTTQAARRLFEIIDTRSEVEDPKEVPPLPQRYDIEFRDLAFRYTPDQPPVLHDLSFRVPENSCVAIVGSSGAGKSTIARLLLRFWEHRQGQILLGGQELQGYRQEDIHLLMSVVAQDTHLFNTSIYENLRIANHDAEREAIITAAKQAQIHDFIESLPQGYDTQVGEQGLFLSGGERQRIAIARALLKDAPILILDEPTTNLDSLTEREILRTLRTLIQGHTTILITHRLVDLDMANEILVLRDGEIAERGSERQLMQNEGLYWQMWNLQHKVLV